MRSDTRDTGKSLKQILIWCWLTEKVKNSFNTNQHQVKIYFKLVLGSNLVNILHQFSY